MNGYKVELGDVDGFVECIRKLWKNSDECQRLGENARKDYEAKYLPEDNYKQLMKIYRDTIKG